MTTHSIHVDFVVNRSLQEQLREKLIAAIHPGGDLFARQAAALMPETGIATGDFP